MAMDTEPPLAYQLGMKQSRQGLNRDSCSLVETNSENSYEGSRNDAETKDFTDELNSKANVKSVLPEEVPKAKVEKSSSVLG